MISKSKPVGTGPFVFASWEKDSKITLKANKYYWDGKQAEWGDMIAYGRRFINKKKNIN